MQQPLAFLSQSDPDTMQYHQAMKQPDWAQFISPRDQLLGNLCSRCNLAPALRRLIRLLLISKRLTRISNIKRQVGLDPRKRYKSTPVPSTKILRRNQKAPAFDKQFHYHSVIGK
eukprot:15335760-Ditylum_brightwellii.AAC.1